MWFSGEEELGMSSGEKLTGALAGNDGLAPPRM